jgi:chemosensory pili system protein ChpA (sensor histidine kinase/response regulator)
MATVLVVDDDEDIRLLLRKHLYEGGYDVLVAEDAIVAGTMIVERAPDLLILDVNMPYMDGFEFAETIKFDPDIPYFPVIFLTVRDDGRDRARAVGAVEYVEKPVTGPQVVQVVRRYLLPDRPPVLTSWAAGLD